MLAIPANIAARFNSNNATEPMLVAAIFADNGAADSLSTFSRLSGAKDPARAADVNIAALPQTSELTLSAGMSVALIQYTSPLNATHRSEWGVAQQISFTWRRTWGGIENEVSPISYYGRFATTPLDVKRKAEPSIALEFVASGSCIVDNLRIQIGNAGSLATTATIRFIDIAQPNSPIQIGNATSLYLAAFAPYLTRVLAGFSANLVRGRKYALEIRYTTPNFSDVATLTLTQQLTKYYDKIAPYRAPTGVFTLTTNHNVLLTVGGFDIGSIPPLWQIPIVYGCIPLGGRTGYQAAGTAYRSLDVCANGKPAPTANGVFSYVDLIAAGTALSINAWATDNRALYLVAGIAGWAAIGRMTSGMSVPPYRYWRFRINLRSNAQNDDTPRLQNISVSYMQPPILLGTHAQAVSFPASGNAYHATAIKAINAVSSSTAALDSQAKTIMTGKLTLELAPEPIVEQLFAHYLRGKRVVLRAGYADIPDTVLYYDGIIRDIAFAGGKYTLTIQDPIELADVSVPRHHWPAFNNTQGYASGIKVMFNDKAYQTLKTIVAPTAPVILENPDKPSVSTLWQAAPSIWQDIAYLPNTHLCDAAADLLQNQINLADEKIDLASLNAVQAQYPNRLTQGRDIAQPTKAIDLLSEIAWLTDSFWLMKEGRLSLIAEAQSTDAPVMYLTPHDIKEGLQYRRGWAELKNEVLIFTGWTGGATSNDQYRQAIGIADADSAANYNMVAVQEFQDKWNVPLPELNLIAQAFLNRWKNGRRIVRIDCAMRTLPLECGDVVELASAQLPKGDNNRLTALIQGKDLNWMNQTITLTLLEI